jgi:hypothetical protein
MLRTALFLAVLIAAPAWAVGERIVLPSGGAFAEQLKETLCISMECVGKGGAVDATITGKLKGDKVIIEVIAPSGVVKAKITAPANDAGRMGSTDLVSATSAVIAAIEGPEPSKVVKADKPEKKAKHASKSKKKGVRLAAKRAGANSRG